MRRPSPLARPPRLLKEEEAFTPGHVSATVSLASGLHSSQGGRDIVADRELRLHLKTFGWSRPAPPPTAEESQGGVLPSAHELTLELDIRVEGSLLFRMGMGVGVAVSMPTAGLIEEVSLDIAKPLSMHVWPQTLAPLQVRRPAPASPCRPG